MAHDFPILSTLVVSLALALGCGDETGDTGGSAGSADSTESESGTDTQTESGSASGDSASASGGEGGSASGEGSTGDGDGDGDGDTGLGCGELECAECYSCATADPLVCAEEKLACTTNPACVLISTCVLGCGAVDDPGFEECHDDCVDGQLGEDLFKALGACLACDVCDCPDHPEC